MPSSHSAPTRHFPKFYRTDVHVKDRQTAVSGVFDANLDNPTSKDLTGTATGAGRSDKLEVVFHATLKKLRPPAL